MSNKTEKNNKFDDGTEFIEFVLADEAASSPSGTAVTEPVSADEVVSAGTLAPSTKLEDMPPVFRELAVPKLPTLPKAPRGRLLMQSPNRLFFYWSVGANPFQRLNKVLGTQTANYALVLKLVDLKRESEQIHRAEPDGSWWFDVEANGSYRAEIGFYAPNAPYVRVLYSNVIDTPRRNPSPRVDSERDWALPSDSFARVLEAAGFSEDAFDVALAGDDADAADAATRDALAEIVERNDVDVTDIDAEEIRNAMLLLASGKSLESMRWEMSPRLFEILQQSGPVDSERALEALKSRFEIEDTDLSKEEFGPAVFGASIVNFPKRRIKTRSRFPRPVSSSARA